MHCDKSYVHVVCRILCLSVAPLFTPHTVEKGTHVPSGQGCRAGIPL